MMSGSGKSGAGDGGGGVGSAGVGAIVASGTIGRMVGANLCSEATRWSSVGVVTTGGVVFVFTAGTRGNGGPARLTPVAFFLHV